MHCNLRPFDAVPVLIRFNYDAHTKAEVSHPFLAYDVSTADTLPYAVTLTFDPLTLNDLGLSPVFVARSISQMLSPVFTGSEHSSAWSSNWRSLSTELFMALHLGTFQTGCSTLLICRLRSSTSSLFDVHCRRLLFCSCWPTTLEQSVCRRPVCPITRNISSQTENTFISAIIPRYCSVAASPQWYLKLLLLGHYK